MLKILYIESYTNLRYLIYLNLTAKKHKIHAKLHSKKTNSSAVDFHYKIVVYPKKGINSYAASGV